MLYVIKQFYAQCLYIKSIFKKQTMKMFQYIYVDKYLIITLIATTEKSVKFGFVFTTWMNTLEIV